MNIFKILEIREHSAAVYSLDFDGHYLYSASADKFVTRWNLESGLQDKFAIRFEESPYSVKVFDHFLVAGLSNGAVHVFDLLSSQEIKHIAQHVKAIFSLAYSDEHHLMFIGDADGNLSVWSTDDWTQQLYLPFDCGKIRDISFNEGQQLVSLSCQDGQLRILDINTFSEVYTIDAHKDGTCTSCFIDDQTVLSGGKDAFIRKWSLVNGNEKSIPAHNFAIYRMRFLNKKNLVTVSRDKTIKIWNDELNVIKRLEAKDGGHTHSVNDLCLLDEYRFATCSDDRRIILWEVK